MSDELPEELAAHIVDPECSFAPPGWHALLLRMHAQMMQVTPDYVLLQVKEKFEGLRVYVAPDYPQPVAEQLRACVVYAQAQAQETCATCGGPGRQRPPTRMVRCDACMNG